jgi:hypothetical protein
MRYCEPIIQGNALRGINTYFYCDWKDRLYSSASECFNNCSPLLVSKSDVHFIVLLVASLFVLVIVSFLMKVVLE